LETVSLVESLVWDLFVRIFLIKNQWKQSGIELALLATGDSNSYFWHGFVRECAALGKPVTLLFHDFEVTT